MVLRYFSLRKERGVFFVYCSTGVAIISSLFVCHDMRLMLITEVLNFTCCRSGSMCVVGGDLEEI